MKRSLWSVLRKWVSKTLVIIKIRKLDNLNLSPELATRAWGVLHNWRVKGIFGGVSIESSNFKNWIKTVLNLANKSGRFSITQQVIGEALSNVSPDTSGLWINKFVAEVLNHKPDEELRRGFAIGFQNNRGAHWIDETGKEEHNLAESIKSKARDLEKEGYILLATTIYQVADNHFREAKRIKEQYSKDTDD